ncbi:MAG: hypothetical protein ABIK68_11955 [bacterium]
MKKLILICLALALMVGCKSDSDDDAATATTPTTTTVTSFRSKTAEVLPEFAPTASSSNIAGSEYTAISGPSFATTMGSGDMHYDLYKLLAKYDATVDSAFGVENIYTNLEHGSVITEKLLGDSTADVSATIAGMSLTISTSDYKTFTAKTINLPFTFASNSLNAAEYVKGKTVSISQLGPMKFVWTQSGSDVALMVSRHATGREHEYLQGKYTASSNELIVNGVNWSNDDGLFVLRSQVTGNVDTHAFEVKLVRGSGTNYTNNAGRIAGKGTSEGTGAYYLFKTEFGNGGAGTWTGTYEYYCIKAGISKTDFETFHNSGTPTNTANIMKYAATADVDAGPCASYRTAVDTLFTGIASVTLDFTESTYTSDFTY